MSIVHPSINTSIQSVSQPVTQSINQSVSQSFISCYHQYLFISDNCPAPTKRLRCHIGLRAQCSSKSDCTHVSGGLCCFDGCRRRCATARGFEARLESKVCCYTLELWPLKAWCFCIKMAKSANFYTHPNTDFCVTSCASSFSVTHNGLPCSALFVEHTSPALLCLCHCLLFCVYFTVFDGVFNFLLAGCVQRSCQLYAYGEACPFGFPSVSLSVCLPDVLPFLSSAPRPGKCPILQPPEFRCVGDYDECEFDGDCYPGKKCCSNTCFTRCVNPTFGDVGSGKLILTP